MSTFRSWSRRAYVLHGYLMAMLILLPVPHGRLLVAEDEPPPDPPPEEEVWWFDHSESMVTVSLGSSGEAPLGADVTLQALVETTSWDVYTSSYGNVLTDNYQTSPASSAWISWNQLSGDGALTSTASWTDAYGLAEATFMMGSTSAVVEVQVDYGGGDTASATLTLEPAPSPADTWTYTGTASSLSSAQWLAVDGGTSGLVPGETRTLGVEVQKSTWDQWTNNGTGETQAQNTTYEPAVNAPVTFYIQSGDGSLDSMSSVTATTDWQGRAYVTFTMGGGSSVVAVLAGDAATGELDGGSVEFTPGTPADEIWELTSSESSLSVSLAAEYDSTELAPGEERFLLATVTQTTWDVYTSNYGNTMDDNVNTTAAAQVPVYFTLEEGDGTVYDQATSGPDGVAATPFQMGTAASRVRADVLDENGIPVSSATLDLTLYTEEWTHTSDEATLLVNLSTPDSLVDVAAGTVCTVTAEVRYQSWEIWTSSSGLVEKRNDTESAAEGASLTWAVESGDGTLVDVTTSTNAEGLATVTFTMGAQDSRLRADAWFGGIISSAATLDFTAASTEPEWIWQSSESALDVYLTPVAGGDGVNAQVSLVTWDVYALSTDPTQTEERNVASSPAIGAEVNFYIPVGTVATSTAWANDNGDASTGYVTTESTEITATAYFGSLYGSGSLAVESNALTITTETLPDGYVGIDYAAPIVVAHGTAPYSFTLLSGSGDTGLPFGYDLGGPGIVGVGDSSTGSQQAGSYSFTLEVSDSSGQTAQKQLSLVLLPVSEAPLAIATESLPYAGTGIPYSTSVQVTGSQSTSGVDFSVDALPPGMTFDNTGLLSGTVPAAGSYTFNVTAQEMGTGGEVRSASAALTLVAVNPEVTVVSGNEQVAWSGEGFEPLTVRLTVAGTPVPWAQVTFEGATVITDGSGLAQWDPGMAPATMGVFTIAANGGGTGATFLLGSAGVRPVPPDGPTISSEPQLGPPKIPDVEPLADAEAEVESRWLSVNKGTVNAAYSNGTATGFNNGNLSSVNELSNPPPYSKNGATWSASDGRTEQPAPAPGGPGDLGDNAWVSGAATASFLKLPNTDDGPVEGDNLGGGSSNWIPPWAQLISFGGWYGNCTDRSEETEAEVRLKRVSGTEAVSRTFIAVTEEDGVVTDVEPVTLTIAGANPPTKPNPDTESQPYLLTVSTDATGKLVTKRLMPIDVMQSKLMPYPIVDPLVSTQQVRMCRWRDAFGANHQTFDANFIATDPDRVVFRLPKEAVDQNKKELRVTVTGIEGASGQTTDTGVLALELINGMWESKPIIFVADPEDDLSFNGQAGLGSANDGTVKTPNPDNDQTRLASFGATISIGFRPPGQSTDVLVPVATIASASRTVQVKLHRLSRTGAVSANQANEATIQAQFDFVRLIYRQIGIDVVQNGPIANQAYPADIWALVNSQDYSLDGAQKTSAQATHPNMTMFDYLDSLSGADTDINLYWIDDVGAYTTSGRENDYIATAGEAELNGNTALLTLIATEYGRQVTGHELGHCLGLSHPAPANDSNQRLMHSGALNWIFDYTAAKRFYFAEPLFPNQ